MTNEEKQLLVRDLSARLQYGVKIVHYFPSGDNKSLLSIEGTLEGISSSNVLLDVGTFPIFEKGGKYSLPYLRPMSSMTEDEEKEFENLGWRIDELENNEAWAFNHSINSIMKGVDWLDKNMFDYRGLIPKGLALEAKEGMYNIK